MQLNGKQTIYQMIRLADEIKVRGGVPDEPLAYKKEYHDRLMARITQRRESLRSGAATPEQYMVPFSREILAALRQRGIALYLASGTDEAYVIEEVALLGLRDCFDGVYGARDDYRASPRNGDPAHPPGAPRSRAKACWSLAMATWKSRMARRPAASRWQSPAMKPAGAAGPIPGNASG